MTPFDSNTHADRNRTDEVKTGTVARFNAETHAFADLVNFVVRTARVFAKWYHGRAVAAQLNELDDRMLEDIGLARHQINDFAAGRLTLGPTLGKPLAKPATPANDRGPVVKQPGIDTPLAA